MRIGSVPAPNTQIYVRDWRMHMSGVKHTEARGRGGVRITSGITGIAAPAAPGGRVMPEVRRTSGRPPRSDIPR